MLNIGRGHLGSVYHIPVTLMLAHAVTILISSLECDKSESDSFKYLKRYIREIDMDTKMLLRFLTASDLMLYNSEGNFFKIQVKIVDLEGIARRPVAYTCGRVLDLSRMYKSYPIFKSEMNAVLNSNIWVMDFA